METTARRSTPSPNPLALLLVRWVALAVAFAFTAWVLNGVDITVDGGWTAMGTGYPSIGKLVTPGNPATSIRAPEEAET